MPGLGVLFALDAIDTAHRAEAARKRDAPAPPTVDRDGRPLDGLSDVASEARLAAWRAWARRSDAGWDAPTVDLVPRRGATAAR